MRISPLGYAKLAVLAAIIALVTLLIIWSRAQYTIDGVIAVENQPTPSDLEVRLIAASVEDDVALLTNDLAMLQQSLTHTIVTQLAARVAIEKKARQKKDTLDVDTLDVSRRTSRTGDDLGPRTPDEENELAARMERYLSYALYCRERMKECGVGTAFYEHGAQFWEDKVAALRASGRLAADDATRAYETEWLAGQGLGDEPVQRVRAFISTNAVYRELHKELTDAAARKQAERAAAKKPKEGGLVAGSALTTNDVLPLVDALLRTLQQRQQEALLRAEEGMLNATLGITRVDNEGRFAFKNGSVQPGHFVVFARMEVLSLDGERMEYMWFEPVYVPLKRFAFNKRVTARLTELNTRTPAVLNAAPPSRDTIISTIVTELRSSAL
jgi:hypothetical protein